MTDASGGTLAFNGDMVITQAITESSVDFEISGDRLRVIEISNSNVISFSLAEYTSANHINPLIGVAGEEPFTLTASGDLMSSRFAGEIHYHTTRDLAGTGSGLPSAGEIVITGDGGVTITVKPQGEILVLLELDLDGDGASEITIPTTWAEITA